jgi:hypothetical protein
MSGWAGIIRPAVAWTGIRSSRRAGRCYGVDLGRDEKFHSVGVVLFSIPCLSSVKVREFAGSASELFENFGYDAGIIVGLYGCLVHGQNEFKRVSKGGAMDKLDLKRYSVDKPQPPLDKDVQVPYEKPACAATVS